MSLVQLVYSGKVDSAKEQQLQRLCAKVTSTVDLAGARVKVALSPAGTCFFAFVTGQVHEECFTVCHSALSGCAQPCGRYLACCL